MNFYLKRKQRKIREKEIHEQKDTPINREKVEGTWWGKERKGRALTEAYECGLYLYCRRLGVEKP
jgi:hypothetical protein